MYRLFLTILFFLIILRGESQNLYILGHVVDVETNRGIPGVDVWLICDSLIYRPESDEHGYFRMSGVLDTTYNLIARKSGYNQCSISNYHTSKHQGTILMFEMCKEDQINKTPYRNVKCPNGHKNKKIIPILHGLHDSADSVKAEKGEVILGGQSTNLCQARWFCRKDSLEF